VKALVFGVKPESFTPPEDANQLVKNLAFTPVALAEDDLPRGEEMRRYVGTEKQAEIVRAHRHVAVRGAPETTRRAAQRIGRTMVPDNRWPINRS